MRFNNKVVLITGGGTGIGKATALAFAREGATVAICGRRETPLRETVEELTKLGGKAAYFICDISRAQEVKKVVLDVAAKYGRIDVLFNNAGINLPAPIEKLTDEDVNDIVDINVKGYLWMLREVVVQMRRQGGGGAIVNTSSQIGLIGHANMVTYCASKGAVSNMTRALALETAKDGIRVNAICPGAINTYLLHLTGAEEVAGFLGGAPMKRAAETTEVAMGVLFLASEEASYITGINLSVDGGFTAGK